MIAEVDYTIQIYSPILKKTERNEFIMGACFLVFGLAYIITNGYKAEVNTARLQVPVEYVGLIVVILFLASSGVAVFRSIFFLGNLRIVDGRLFPPRYRKTSSRMEGSTQRPTASNPLFGAQR